jgi:hypothetical protein
VFSGNIERQLKQRSMASSYGLLHFYYRPLFAFDTGLHHLWTGTCAGVKIPWLSAIDPSVKGDAALVVPPLLYRTPHLMVSNSRGKRLENLFVLTNPWDPSDEQITVASVLKSHEHAHRIVSAAYGEIASDFEGTGQVINQAADYFVGLRDRVSAHLHKIYGAGVLEGITDEDLCALRNAIQTKIREEHISIGKATEKAEDPSSLDALQEDAQVLSESRRVLIDLFLRRLADGILGCALSRAAELTAAPLVRSSTPQKSTDVTSISFLQQAFEKKGLGALSRTLTAESIDVIVFKSMTPEELKDVFRATFGVVKKLQQLQSELHSHSARNR